MKNKWLSIVALGIAMSVSSLFHSPTYALNNQSNISFYPADQKAQSTGYYMEALTPGTKKTYGFYINNPSNESKTLDVYPSDALTARGGGKNFKNPDEANKNVGSWFSSGKETITVGPNETKKMEFTLKVPDALKSGQYVGYVSVLEKSDKPTNISTKENEASYNIKVVNRYGIQIVINHDIKNALNHLELQKVEVEEIQTGNPNLLVNILNDGTILQKPLLKFNLYDEKGEEIETGSLKTDSIYENTVGEIPLSFKTNLSKGKYSIKIELDYSGIKSEKKFEFSINSEPSEEQTPSPGETKQPLPHVQPNELSFLIKLYIIVSAIIIISALVALIVMLIKKKKKGENDETLEKDIID